MKRRDFIQSTIALSSAAILPVSCAPSNTKPNFKMGYQLYSIRDEMAKDPIATLKALKDMGYQDFEHFGFDDQKGTFYGFEPIEFKKLLDNLELTVTSGHYGFSSYLEKSNEELEAFVDRCIIGAKKIDSKYIVWPWIAPEQRNMENFRKMCPKLNLIGEKVTAAGLGFAYHNHGFEFEDHNGENGFEVIIKNTDPNLVKLEIDMYWVMHSSNYTPKELIKEQPGRYKLWHIKDMDKVSRDYTELGNGSIDYIKELPNPGISGLEYYYIEQGGNYAMNSMQSAKSSAIYFKQKLQQFL